MKCVICEIAEVLPDTTTLTFERGETTVVIKAVPAEVCPFCGEAYIDEGITPRLSALADAAASSGAAVEVRRFAAA